MSLNGHKKTRDLDALLERRRKQLELARINAELRLRKPRPRVHHHGRPAQPVPIRESSEGFAWLDGYSELIDRVSGPDRDFLFPFSTANDRRYGANWPFWRTTIEHARLRAAARFVVTNSPLAGGALSALTAYAVGEGMPTTASAVNASVPRILVDTVNHWLEEFADLNNWHSRQCELFSRGRRDGEFFLRLFPQPDGTCKLRIVEPEYVMEPPGESYERVSFGVITDPEDTLDVEGYWVAYDGNAGGGEFVPVANMLHLKENVDETVKRGLTDFCFDVLDYFKNAAKLIEGLAVGSAIQANIAGIRQHQSATSGMASDFVSSQADYEETVPFTGGTRNVQRITPGTMLDIDSGQEYVVPPFATNVAGFTSVVQAVLRAVAVKWNAPEWLVSADASNNNMASSIVAESPFVKRMKVEQKRYARAFQHVSLQALKHYCRTKGGIRVNGETFDWETLTRLLKFETTPPTVETRNKGEEASMNREYIQLGVKSRQQAARELGLDWETQEKENEEYERKHGDQGVPADQAGGGGLADMLGGGGEEKPDEGQGQQEPEQPAGDDEQQNQPQQDIGSALAGLLGESRESVVDRLRLILESLQRTSHPDVSIPEAEMLAEADAGLMEAGKTGQFKDKGNRNYCLRDGKRVACSSLSDAEKSLGSGKDAAPASTPDVPQAKPKAPAKAAKPKAEKLTPEKAAETVKAALASPGGLSDEQKQSLVATLVSLTAEQIKDVRAKMGLEGPKSGTKQALAEKLVAAALGERKPAKKAEPKKPAAKRAPAKKPAEPAKPAEPTPPSTTEMQASAARAYERIRQVTGGFVTVPELTDQVMQETGATQEQAHNMLLDWAKTGEITLQVNNDPHLDPRSKESIQSSEGVLHYVHMGNKARGLAGKPAEKPAPAKPGKPTPPTYESVARDIVALNVPNPRTGTTPLVPALYDQLAKKHPGLTKQQFGDVINRMAAEDLLTPQLYNDAAYADDVGYKQDDFPQRKHGGPGPIGWVSVRPDAAERLAEKPVVQAKPGKPEKPAASAQAQAPGQIDTNEARKAIRDSIEGGFLYRESHGNLVPMDLLYHIVKQKAPGLTLEQMHAELARLSRERKVELQVINEYHSLTPEQKATVLTKENDFSGPRHHYYVTFHGSPGADWDTNQQTDVDAQLRTARDGKAYSLGVNQDEQELSATPTPRNEPAPASKATPKAPKPPQSSRPAQQQGSARTGKLIDTLENGKPKPMGNAKGEVLPGTGQGKYAATARPPAHAVRAAVNGKLPAETRPAYTLDEAVGLASYGQWSDVNHYLRTGSKMEPEVAEAHKLLQEAFARTPAMKDPVPVFRGVGFSNEEQAQKYLAPYLEAARGKTPLRHTGYVSTTTDEKSATSDYALNPRYGRKSGVVFEIQATRGVDMAPYNAKPDQQELLLNHQSEFQVDSVVQEGGVWRVKMKQVS